MRVALIDIGMGNLGSVEKCLREFGVEVAIAQTPEHLSDADRIVLPGVGSFHEGAMQLTQLGFRDALTHLCCVQKIPLLGICLGMQLLATHGEEGGIADGLNLIPGRVKKIDPTRLGLRLPHVGWNEVRRMSNSKIYVGIPDGTDFYFVHSYAFSEVDINLVTGWTDYGDSIVASVQNGVVFGTQFHPEKSSRFGRQLLKNFLELARC